jgi:hypothetical protein
MAKNKATKMLEEWVARMKKPGSGILVSKVRGRRTRKHDYYDRYIERKLGKYVTIMSPPGWPVSSCAMATCRMITANRMLDELLDDENVPADKRRFYEQALKDLWEMVIDPKYAGDDLLKIVNKYLTGFDKKDYVASTVYLVAKLALELRKMS